MNSFQRREAVREQRRQALARGYFGAHDLALFLGVTKRRAQLLLAAGRVPDAVRDKRTRAWMIPVQLTGDLLITPGRRGPKLRVKDKRPRRQRVWRV
jgi:hypothetical protein